VPKRYRQGLAGYSPKRAQAARYRSATPGRKQRAKVARALKRSQLTPSSPKPGTAAGRRRAEQLLGPLSTWPAEAVALRNAAGAEALGRPGYEGSRALWHEYLDDLYRPAYRAAVADKSAATRARRAAAKPKGKGAWIRVRAHRRRRPGRS
jgi:hypothetical protein